MVNQEEKPGDFIQNGSINSNNNDNNGTGSRVNSTYYTDSTATNANADIQVNYRLSPEPSGSISSTSASSSTKSPSLRTETESRSSSNSSAASANVNGKVDPNSINSRGHVRKACLDCRRRHLACDLNRPCKRCVMAGLECIEGEHRKRGRPRTKDRLAQMPKPGYPYSTLAPASQQSMSVAHHPHHGVPASHHMHHQPHHLHAHRHAPYPMPPHHPLPHPHPHAHPLSPHSASLRHSSPEHQGQYPTPAGSVVHNGMFSNLPVANGLPGPAAYGHVAPMYAAVAPLNSFTIELDLNGVFLKVPPGVSEKVFRVPEGELTRHSLFSFIHDADSKTKLMAAIQYVVSQVQSSTPVFPEIPQTSALMQKSSIEACVTLDLLVGHPTPSQESFKFSMAAIRILYPGGQSTCYLTSMVEPLSPPLNPAYAPLVVDPVVAAVPAAPVVHPSSYAMAHPAVQIHIPTQPSIPAQPTPTTTLPVTSSSIAAVTFQPVPAPAPTKVNTSPTLPIVYNGESLSPTRSPFNSPPHQPANGITNAPVPPTTTAITLPPPPTMFAHSTFTSSILPPTTTPSILSTLPPKPPSPQLLNNLQNKSTLLPPASSIDKPTGETVSSLSDEEANTKRKLMSVQALLS